LGLRKFCPPHSSNSLNYWRLQFGTSDALLSRSDSCRAVAKKEKGEIMKISRLTKLVVFMIIYGLGATASPGFSKDKEKIKAKGKQQVETKENRGRTAGELPYGLQQYSEKKGELPAGLQKKKDENGQLTRGLEQGGKNLTTSSKGKTRSK
jgi:hypothetical protein